MTSAPREGTLAGVLHKHEEEILAEWLDEQAARSGRHDALNQAQSRSTSREFLRAVGQSLTEGTLDVRASAWSGVRDVLSEMSAGRAQQGYSPTDTAMFVFSLKRPVFSRLRAGVKDAQSLADAMSEASELFDALGLFTTEAFQRSREDVINRQQRELLELSTPVVELWDDILALPLVGSLDSERTQIVMETLLQKIVQTGASIAIIDITGVPTLDTLVAQPLLKTVAATRLMGADCIISGIRPQIAQTIVHLGVNLGEVMTKATLADAFQTALKRAGARIVAGADGKA